MRFMSDLSTKQLKELKKIYKNGDSQQERERAHAILLSNEGKTVNELMSIFNVSRRTIYRWFDRIKDNDLSKLNDLPGRGRHAILNEEDRELVLSLRKTKTIRETFEILKTEYNRELSISSLKRFLKKIS